LWVNTKFANLFTSHKPLWYRLRANQNIVTGGLGIKALEPMIYPTTTGPALEGVTDPYTEMTPSATTGATNAEYTWCEKRLSVTIEELIMDQQGSDTMKINYLNDFVKNVSMKKFLEGLNSDLWRAETAAGSNGSSRQYLGSVRTYFNRGLGTDGGAIPSALAEQTGAAVGTGLTLVGNIDRATNGNAYHSTPIFHTTVAAGAITLLKLNNVISLAVCDPDSPDLLVTTRGNFDEIMALIQQYQRYDSSALADAGFDAIRYRSCDVVFDQACPSANLFALNTNYIKLRCNSMQPVFTEKPDPHRTIFNWNARWVGQITSGNLGRVHARADAFGGA
jgi:hypothetical protein